MKTLVAYATWKGSTREAAVLGGSVRAGKPNSVVSKFAARHEGELRKKTLGLFVCSMNSEEANRYLELAFGPNLTAHATARIHFGGRYRTSDHGFLVRKIMKSILKSDSDVDTLDFGKVPGFVKSLSSNMP